MANNKVQLANGTVLIDLTDTTANASDVLSGSYFYSAAGVKTEGTLAVDQTYTVTKTLSNVTSSNDDTKVIAGNSFFADLTPAAGTQITSITVMMGGVDVTSQVFTPGTGTKSITANGTYDADVEGFSGYSSINVNVPTADGDYIRAVICDTETFTVPSGSDYVFLSNTARLVNGDDYVVTYDGTEYVCTSTELWGSDRFVGDLPLTWGNKSSDCIFPFCIEDWNSNQNFVVYARDNSQHTIKIEHLELLNGGTTLGTKTITANGTYSAATDNVDGYSSVTVAIPSASGVSF